MTSARSESPEFSMRHGTDHCLICGQTFNNPDCLLSHRCPVERPNYLAVWLLAGMVVLGLFMILGISAGLWLAFEAVRSFITG